MLALRSLLRIADLMASQDCAGLIKDHADQILDRRVADDLFTEVCALRIALLALFRHLSGGAFAGLIIADQLFLCITNLDRLGVIILFVAGISYFGLNDGRFADTTLGTV